MDLLSCLWLIRKNWTLIAGSPALSVVTALAVTDAAALAASCDGALLVVRYGEPREQDVTRALEALSSVNARLIGTVLNRVPARRGGPRDHTARTPAEAELGLNAVPTPAGI